MKSLNFKGAILTVLYLLISFLGMNYLNINWQPFQVLLMPAELCFAPFINKEFQLEQINMSLFSLYFLWSFNCVYLSVINSLLKQATLKILKKI